MDPLPVWAVYSVPEVAGVGLTEEDAKTQGIDYEIGRSSFATLPRGIISGHPEGMLKLVFRRDDHRLLGVHVLGDIASELIGLGQATIHSHGEIDLFNQLTFATPTYTMAYKFAAFDGLQTFEMLGYSILLPGQKISIQPHDLKAITRVGKDAQPMSTQSESTSRQRKITLMVPMLRIILNN